MSDSDADSGADSDGGAGYDARLRVRAAEAERAAALAAAAADPLCTTASARGGGGGAKGVLADKRRADRAARVAADTAALQALHATRVVGGGSRDAAPLPVPSPPHEDSADDSGGSDDGEALARYRAGRLAELRARSSHPPGGAVVVELPDGDAFVAAVDGVHPPRAAVVLLWEAWLPASVPVRGALEALAARGGAGAPAFFALRASLATTSLDPVGLPAVVVYLGGDVLASLLRVHEEAAARAGGPSPRRAGGALTPAVLAGREAPAAVCADALEAALRRAGAWG